jgi:hypothetical protein
VDHEEGMVAVTKELAVPAAHAPSMAEARIFPEVTPVRRISCGDAGAIMMYSRSVCNIRNSLPCRESDIE